MKTKYKIIFCLLLSGFCLNCDKTEKETNEIQTDSYKEPESIKVSDDSANKHLDVFKEEIKRTGIQAPLHFGNSLKDSLDFLINKFLVTNIIEMYTAAASGSKDDKFDMLKDALGNNFTFLSENDLSGWNNLLEKIQILIKETGSKYSLIYWTTTLLNGHKFPTVIIYEVNRSEDVSPPVKEMSEFWNIDFNNLFPENYTFSLEYAKEPLIDTYEIWLQKRRQESILEGMTLKELNKIILFTNDADPVNEKKSFFHEFGHIFFDMKTRHLSKWELENYRLDVVQYFMERSKVTITFTYKEFSELMAKLSELIVTPDEELFHYIMEVSINKMPHYQMTRQLISSTTVYKYLADEHPNEFLKLQHIDITDNDVEKILRIMSKEKTDTGKNKLRSYLDYHVEAVSMNLEEVIFN